MAKGNDGNYLQHGIEVSAALADRAQRVTQLEAGAHLQNAFLLWASVERPQDINGFTEPSQAEFQIFVDEYLPADPYGFDRTVTHVAAENTFVVDGRFGKIDRFSMTWPAGGGAAVEMRVFGSWDTQDVAMFASTLPHAAHECFPSGHAECFGSTAIVPVHLQTTTPSLAFAIDVRHPSVSASTATALRRAITTDPTVAVGDVEGLMSPLAYETRSHVTTGAPCGTTTALALNATGDPMMCFDGNGDGTREWLPANATNFYCRDETITLASDPNYRRNIPGAIPVLEAIGASIQTIQPQASVRGVCVGGNGVCGTGGTGTVVCPAGFANTDPTTDFCTRAR